MPVQAVQRGSAHRGRDPGARLRCLVQGTSEGLWFRLARAAFAGPASGGASDKTLKLYDGHVHDLLNDFGKETVMADVRRWIGERIDRRA